MLLIKKDVIDLLPIQVRMHSKRICAAMKANQSVLMRPTDRFQNKNKKRTIKCLYDNGQEWCELKIVVPLNQLPWLLLMLMMVRLQFTTIDDDPNNVLSKLNMFFWHRAYQYLIMILFFDIHLCFFQVF